MKPQVIVGCSARKKMRQKCRMRERDKIKKKEANCSWELTWHDKTILLMK